MAIKGLDAIRARREEQARQEAERNKPKANYFKWPAGVNVATIRFLQEIDETATNYAASRGLGFVAVEHQAPGPDGFKRRANCTLETEGQCYACEQRAIANKEADKEIASAWRQRQNFYINIAWQFPGEEVQYGVISRTFNSVFATEVFDHAVDENTITDKNFKLKKTGEGTKTQWLPTPDLKNPPLDDSNATVVDLDESVLRAIPYAEQAEYYGAVWTAPVKQGAPADNGTVSSPVDSDEW